jgi:hypothetical protein
MKKLDLGIDLLIGIKEGNLNHAKRATPPHPIPLPAGERGG